VDGSRKVIHPDELVWENGRPRVKTEEEKSDELNLSQTEKEPNPANSFQRGTWTITIS
jgi:hypothetical protein